VIAAVALALERPFTDPATVFLLLAAVILIAPIAAERAKVPGIIGLILAGMAIGPNAANLLQRDGAIALLGGVGLLYLMFLGGLDLDLEGFSEDRRASLLFGATTFVIPMVVLTAAGMAIGLSTLAAILIASAFTSHTPVSYPLVQRFGLAKNSAVTATLGATLLAVVAALLVLAVVAAVHQGDAGPLFWVQLVVSLAAFGAFTAWGLPRLTRAFFSGLGQDRNVRFTFVLVVVFGVSTLAGAAGIEPIVGAFLAGLALNRFIAPGSVLMERVQFLGSSLLVPLFLIATGMLIDPAVLVGDPQVLLAGLVLSAGAILAKLVAAWPVGAYLGFDRAERGVMFSLSVGQAAGALAAVTVAADIGLIDQGTVNASILVILLACLTAAFSGGAFVSRVRQPRPRDRRVGEAVVVPVANPRSAGSLVKLAALIAGPDNGSVVPVNVLGFDASPEEVEEHRAITAEAEKVALANGAEARSLVRIDSSPTAGVLHTVVEGGGTALLIGWKGYANARENFFGGVIDAILANAPVPVFVCRPGSDTAVERIIVSVTRGDLSPGGLAGLALTLDVAERMARQAEVPVLVVTEEEDDRIAEGLEEARKVEVVADERKPPIALRNRAMPGDVVVVGTPPTRAGLGQNAARLARAVPDRTIIAVVPRTA
jgi:Kef-type K+ transport system membrane component KefB